MLVLYIFVPAATLILLLTVLAATSNRTVSTMKSFIADHLSFYRAALVAFVVLLCLSHEFFLVFFGGWLALAGIGLTVRHWLLGGRRNEAEETTYGTYLLPLKAFEIVWGGI